MIPRMESKIAPGFLVAAPHMRDPSFEKTVIFMMEHDDPEGSMGLVINRPAGMTFASLVSWMGLPTPTGADAAALPGVLTGGPVAPELGWILHSDEWRAEQTRILAPGIAVTASLNVVQSICDGRGPDRFLLCLGYAGWGPGQLVAEIRTGAWINVPYEQDLVFDVPLEARWEESIRRLGIDPSSIASMVGDA
jgi:putative transcriptional regulator